MRANPFVKTFKLLNDQTLELPLDFVDSYKDKNVPFGPLGYIVYKRSYARGNEEWVDTIQRCVNGAQSIGADYTLDEMKQLFDYMFHLKCSFAGRLLWVLGTEIIKKYGSTACLNCWAIHIKEPEDFCFLMGHLSLGGGVGFSIEAENIYEFPKVRSNVLITKDDTKDADFIVPDSREGWIELLRKVLYSYFNNGRSFSYSTICIRPKGIPLKTFGGYSSGPEYLVIGIEKICDVLNNRADKKIRPVDALDIANIIAELIVSGAGRRSSEIALGDIDSYAYLKAKRWDLGVPNHRCQSNNSVICNNIENLVPEFWKGYEGNGEPYGLVNRKLIQKRGRLGEKLKDNADLINPCQPAFAHVLTPDGIKQFRNVNVGDTIWSSEGWTTVVDKWSNGIKPIYKFETTASRFYGTREHKIISNNKKIQVKNADSIDICVGNFSTQITINSQDIIDGLVIGDGSVHKASNNLVILDIGQDDQDYFTSEIQNLIQNRYKVHPYSYKIKTTICHNELPRTWERQIPNRFLYGHNDKKIGFLRGLYSANGSICGSKVTLKSSSKLIIEQTQLILSSIGIQSYYTTNRPSNVKFNNGRYLCKKSYDLNISVDIEKFFNLIGFIQNYKIEKLVNIIHKRSNIKYRPSKLTYDIKETEFLGEEEVFDITVDNKTHTYWSDGCNVSNCGEIPLCHAESCNLSELFLPNISSLSELKQCAYLLYKTQKAISAGWYIYEITNKIVAQNMRLGLSVSGYLQCDDRTKVDKWLDKTYNYLRSLDKDYSNKKGCNESIRLTTCKPSGTLSLLPGITPGIHPAYSKYYIRRIRMLSSDPLVQFCKKHGHHVEYEKKFDGTNDHGTSVISFPIESPTTATLVDEMNVIDQLEIMKHLQTIWSDNAVSVTIYYKKEELDILKQWLSDNYNENVKSVSFLLHEDHGFVQAPYEPITQDEYEQMIKKIDPITSMDSGGELLDVECENGSCPVR